MNENRAKRLILLSLLAFLLCGLGLWRAVPPALASAGSLKIGPAIIQQATSTPAPAPPERGRPPLSLTLMLVLTGCSVGGVIAVVVLGALTTMRHRPDDEGKKAGKR